MNNTTNNSESTQGVNSVASPPSFTSTWYLLEEVITIVSDSPSSIFAREDVVHLLNELKFKVAKSYNDTSSLEALKSRLKSRIEDVIDSHDYDENAEFEMSGRSVILSFSSAYLNDEIMDVIEEEFDESVTTEVKA